MKRVLAIFTIFAIFSLTTFSMPGMAHRGHEGFMKTMMFFKMVKENREKLNLTPDQNSKLDRILRDVENYTASLKEEKGKMNFLDNFVQDSFDPFKFEEEKKKKKEEIRNFYLSKIKAIHNLLTKKQREKLVSIIKEKVKKIRKRRIMKMKNLRRKRRWSSKNRREMKR